MIHEIESFFVIGIKIEILGFWTSISLDYHGTQLKQVDKLKVYNMSFWRLFILLYLLLNQKKIYFTYVVNVLNEFNP